MEPESVVNGLVEYVCLFDVSDEHFSSTGTGELPTLASRTLSSCIRERYPKADHKHEPFPHKIDMFAFPSGIKLESKLPSNVYSFMFVLTSFNGERFYGYCSEIYEELEEKKLSIVKMQEAARLMDTDVANVKLISRLYHPRIICVLSFYPFHSSLFKVLNTYLSTFCAKGFPKNVCENLYNILNKPKLVPGGVGACVKVGEKNFDFHMPSNLSPPLTEVDFRILFQLLEPQNVILIFNALLCEISVLLTSSRLHILTQCLETFISLLYPMKWYYTYISVLPSNLKVLFEAPHPFLMGTLSENLNQPPWPDTAMVVDVDNNVITSSPSQFMKLPARLSWKLFHAINHHFNVYQFAHPNQHLQPPPELPLNAVDTEEAPSSRRAVITLKTMNILYGDDDDDCSDSKESDSDSSSDTNEEYSSFRRSPKNNQFSNATVEYLESLKLGNLESLLGLSSPISSPRRISNANVESDDMENKLSNGGDWLKNKVKFEKRHSGGQYPQLHSTEARKGKNDSQNPKRLVRRLSSIKVMADSYDQLPHLVDGHLTPSSTSEKNSRPRSADGLRKFLKPNIVKEKEDIKNGDYLENKEIEKQFPLFSIISRGSESEHSENSMSYSEKLAALETKSKGPGKLPLCRNLNLEQVLGSDAREIEALAFILFKGIEIKDRTWRFQSFRRCFVGKDVVSFLVKNFYCVDEEAAEALGMRMMGEGLISHVTWDHKFKNENLFYRFTPSTDSKFMKKLEKQNFLNQRSDNYRNNNKKKLPSNTTEIEQSVSSSSHLSNKNICKDNRKIVVRDIGGKKIPLIMQTDTLKLRKAFVSVFVQLLKGYRNHLVVPGKELIENEAEELHIFDYEGFQKDSISKDYINFMNFFTGTIMFRKFIEDRLQKQEEDWFEMCLNNYMIHQDEEIVLHRERNLSSLIWKLGRKFPTWHLRRLELEGMELIYYKPSKKLEEATKKYESQVSKLSCENGTTLETVLAQKSLLQHIQKSFEKGRVRLQIGAVEIKIPDDEKEYKTPFVFIIEIYETPSNKVLSRKLVVRWSVYCCAEDAETRRVWIQAIRARSTKLISPFRKMDVEKSLKNRLMNESKRKLENTRVRINI